MTTFSIWLASWFRRLALSRQDAPRPIALTNALPNTLEIPLSAHHSITGTPHQIHLLAQKLQQYALVAPSGEPVRLRLWDDQTLVGAPINLAALGTCLANTLSRLVIAPASTPQPAGSVQRGIFHPAAAQA